MAKEKPIEIIETQPAAAEVAAVEPTTQTTPNTAPLTKPLGMMTWDEECAYYKERRALITGEANNGTEQTGK